MREEQRGERRGVASPKAQRTSSWLVLMKAIEKLVSGKEIDLEELLERVNQAQIQKNYKISDPELGISSLVDAIACRIAACHAL
ncbi:hypothetical protein LOK49_LG05G01804 [Camellia lanceoleosa]|uniref:Uncharacterized protein n=1 Tax=Camellia lanceoleosa TaxID=1840588 RepID=A0ACC0HR30_9ERIC|nr:hypothetical protein LOK49_LG05G01804 [Camellia lanceoleosa]